MIRIPFFNHGPIHSRKNKSAIFSRQLISTVIPFGLNQVIVNPNSLRLISNWILYLICHSKLFSFQCSFQGLSRLILIQLFLAPFPHGIRKINKGISLKFPEDQPDEQSTTEGRRTQRWKHCDNIKRWRQQSSYNYSDRTTNDNSSSKKLRR